MNYKFINKDWEKYELIEYVDIDFLLKIRNKNQKEEYELQNRNKVTKEELWLDILNNGMHEPFFLTYGEKLKTIRLESGNHRIHLFKKNNIKYIPCVVFVNKTGIMFEGNGNHIYNHHFVQPKESIKLNKIKNYTYSGYATNPRNILNECVLKNK